MPAVLKIPERSIIPITKDKQGLKKKKKGSRSIFLDWISQETLILQNSEIHSKNRSLEIKNTLYIYTYWATGKSKAGEYLLSSACMKRGKTGSSELLSVLFWLRSARLWSFYSCPTAMVMKWQSVRSHPEKETFPTTLKIKQLPSSLDKSTSWSIITTLSSYQTWNKCLHKDSEGQGNRKKQLKNKVQVY